MLSETATRRYVIADHPLTTPSVIAEMLVAETGALNLGASRLLDHRIIGDRWTAFHPSPLPGRLRHRCARSSCAGVEPGGKLDNEGAARLFMAFDPDGPSEHRDELLGDGESQACAFMLSATLSILACICAGSIPASPAALSIRF